jgi:cytochrome o ubiquinol oxidase subunit 2
MSNKKKLWVSGALILALIIMAGWKLKDLTFPVLQPSGPIGYKEKNLIVIASLLSLIVVVPVFAMLIGFSIRYREGNSKARYDPALSGSRLFESIWWGVPLIIISILAVITWHSSRELDPFKQIDSRPALTIQVVALQWKWLFIYPDQKIATVNYVQFPANTPINFVITSDAPMNSFWIPELGGQIYAMSGMKTQLHLEASKVGNYAGASANISGEGFSSMHFVARASSQADFNNWLFYAKNTQLALDQSAYDSLSTPSKNIPTTYYKLDDEKLYDRVIAKYSEPLYVSPSGGSL